MSFHNKTPPPDPSTTTVPSRTCGITEYQPNGLPSTNHPPSLGRHYDIPAGNLHAMTNTLDKLFDSADKLLTNRLVDADWSELFDTIHRFGKWTIAHRIHAEPLALEYRIRAHSILLLRDVLAQMRVLEGSLHRLLPILTDIRTLGRSKRDRDLKERLIEDQREQRLQHWMDIVRALGYIEGVTKDLEGGCGYHTGRLPLFPAQI